MRERGRIVTTEVASVVKMAVEETSHLGSARIKIEGLFSFRETILRIGKYYHHHRYFKQAWRLLVL
jgi:hypothetical protein